MCSPIIIKLVAEAMSLWAMTSVPVMVCTYDVNGAQFTVRQVGVSCSKQPSKIPATTERIAMHNACATKAP